MQEYIDSGVLFDYCAGVLSPAEMQEVDRVCAAFPPIRQELDELSRAVGRPLQGAPGGALPDLEETIWGSLDNINREKSGDIGQLPVVNKYSNHTHWQRIVQPFMPAERGNERTVTTIRDTGGITQMLIVSRTDVAEEVHEHERESFIVLEGECECIIGEKKYHLGPGGYIEIPLHTRHNVRVLSPYVVAVLQHIAV